MSYQDSIDVRVIVDSLLETEALPVSPEEDCPYLPDRAARCEGFLADDLDPEIYAVLVERGFRRSGRLVYRAACTRCSACQSLRVPVAGFSPSRSQKRVLRRNRDLRVTAAEPRLTDAKWRMYVTYLDQQHDHTMSRSREDLERFLYDSPAETIEMCYHLSERLVGVSLVDRSPTAVSSVYMYFDPAHSRRSLGTYSALREIDYCRRAGVPYYYLGYYVAAAPKMAYKSRFGPCEVLDTSGRWVPWRRQENE